MPKKAIEEMYLRDWFAGMALNGATSEDCILENADGIAKGCYVFADAMMKARMEARPQPKPNETRIERQEND